MNSDFIKAIVAIWGFAISVAISFWIDILKWANDILYPWLERNFKEIIPSVKEAFAWFDRYVAVPTRRLIKKAWKTLRQHLLNLAVQFERQSSNEWIRRWTAYMIKKLDTGQVVPVKQTTEEKVEWEYLPPDVRAEWLRKTKGVNVDVTTIRDAQVKEDDDLDEMDMMH